MPHSTDAAKPVAVCPHRDEKSFRKRAASTIVISGAFMHGALK
jgi:hypothetical protein